MFHHSRKLVAAAQALALAGTFLLALTFNTAPLRAESVLRIVPQADLKSLDPLITAATITRIYGYFVYDRLFELNSKAEPVPQMVDKFEQSKDGLTYTFTLRDGLRFHDGRPVKTADVLASIERWGRLSVGLSLMTNIAKLEAVNDKTFRFHMKQPWSLTLDAMANLGGTSLFILPADVAKKDPKVPITDTIGSGPFKFDPAGWVPGNKVSFVKNADYVARTETPSWASGAKVPKVDRVEWRIISDPQTQLAALRTGEVDVLEDPAPDLLVTVAGDPDIVTGPLDPYGRQGQLYLNQVVPPFNNVKARLAMMYLIDQKNLLPAIAGDPENWTECYTVYACGSAYETDVGAEPLKAFDIDKAKQLFKEAGYNGEPLTLLASTTFAFMNVTGLVLAENMRKAGLKVDLQQPDWGTVLARRESKDVPDGRGKGWSIMVSATKAVTVTNPALHTRLDGRCEKGLQGWSCNPKFEELKDAFARELDEGKKMEIAKNLQKLNYEHVAYIPIGQWKNHAAWRKEVKNFVLSPTPVYWNVTKN